MRYFSDDSTYPLSDPMLDQFCLRILPEIHHRIKWLNLESSCMKQILLATNYPNLCGLGLYNIDSEKALSLFIDAYDKLIVPLLQHMSTLEKLHLNVYVYMEKIFIDGNNLKKNIIDHMARLKNFTFNIDSFLHLRNQIDLTSTEDIKHTFRDFKNNHIISYIDYFHNDHSSRCFIYTYPYKWKSYGYITNNFPGVLCKFVREITLYDEHPFEYEFFLRISQSFPFLKELSVMNSKPQKNKLCRESNKDNQDLSIIKFHYLTSVTLYSAHDDYIEQFLDDSKTFLSNNVHLNVYFESLKRVTYHFTRNTTRTNCAKLKSLFLNGYGLPKYARDYFSHTKVL
ncbi:unnamed protein product [Rotaria sp. Silwood2]|nr:unnamed protein product [Rotaria sp. Silwood2]CAF4337050.1 unnamed protein product [Rotaria sp. Silwood2]